MYTATDPWNQSFTSPVGVRIRYARPGLLASLTKNPDFGIILYINQERYSNKRAVLPVYNNWYLYIKKVLHF